MSATFVYREVLALRRMGLDVSCLSMKSVEVDGLSVDALPFLSETDNIYGSGFLRNAIDATMFAAMNPRKSFKVLVTAMRDTFCGSFAKLGQRGKLLPQALVGLGVARRLERMQIDHLHVHFAHSVANVGMYAAMASNIDWSLTGHANDLWVQGSLLREKIQRSVFFRTISDANKEDLKRLLGPIADQAKVIRCGVDVRSELLAGDPATTPRKQRVLFVSRLVHKKGADVLLRAFKSISSEFPCLQLDIVGDGPQRPVLESLCKRLGVQSKVKFHGFQNLTRIAHLLGTSHAFVLPCRRADDGDRDGIPVVLMEAMAAGIPVISTKLPGIDELIEDGRTGILTEENDPDLLATALRGIISNPEAASRISYRATEFVRDNYDLYTNASTLIQHIAPGHQNTKETPADLPSTHDGVVIVTPFRNESKHIRRIVHCMIAQSVKPKKWILVDDGSTDDGPDYVRAVAATVDWIQVVKRPDRGKRALGSGVVAAFQDGLKMAPEDYSYVAKMDADMSFGSQYIETALRRLQENSRLACISGKVYRPEAAGPIEEFMIDDMVAGQFKFYRREAFEEIGGFVENLLWDGIDYHRCRQRNWQTTNTRAPEMRLCHHRLMGSSDGNILRGRLRLGRGQWFMGTHPLYLLASAAWRLLEKPFIIGGVLIVVGYVKSMLTGIPRYEDQNFRKELHRWQLGRLFRVIKNGAIR
ncbi:MAG: biofilm PGA synthesis N-glycosyltransferase PgaC [Planctomycetota bacterium]